MGSSDGPHYGPSEVTRPLVDVLLLVREPGAGHVDLAVHGALAAGARDGRAVEVLVKRTDRPPPVVIVDLPNRLTLLGSPERTIA